MRNVLLTLAALATIASGQALSQAPAAEDFSKARPRAESSNSFLVTWVGVYNPPTIRIEGTLTATVSRLEGFKNGDVVISGPWGYGRHVWYSTLHIPTDKELVAAVKAAQRVWEHEQHPQKAVSQTAIPKESKSATPDRRNELPVGSVDALDELNAKRAREGLKPFIRDEGLMLAAARAAKERASRLLFGHLPNDFIHLPNGCNADAAGCAAYHESYGWMSCYMNPQTGDNGYRYAGAAWALGSDGKRYMHLFVRHK